MTRWFIWLGFVITWSIALEIPFRKPDTGAVGEFIAHNDTLVSKGIHVCVYAIMAMLSAWVRTPTRYRWLMVVFLMVHATGSELLQFWLEPYFHRGGKLTDVGWDNFGILIGMILSWKWWTRIDTDCV